MNMVPENVPDKLKAFMVVGGNPLITMPDSNALRDAFKKLDLLVVFEQFMTETAEFAHYVLPAANQFEFNGLAYNYNVCHCLPYLMLRSPMLHRFHECKSIREVYTELAQRCGFGEKFPWKSGEELVAYELAPSGVTLETLKAHPEGHHFQATQYGCTERSLQRLRARSRYTVRPSRRLGLILSQRTASLKKSPMGTRWAELGSKYPLILSTGTRDLNFNGSMLHNIESTQARSPFPKAEIGPATAAHYRVRHMDDVIVETDRGWVKMKASVDERVMEGVVLVPHGWPGEANCNYLTDCQCREPIMGYPQWKGLLCNIRKVTAEVA